MPQWLPMIPLIGLLSTTSQVLTNKPPTLVEIGKQSAVGWKTVTSRKHQAAETKNTPTEVSTQPFDPLLLENRDLPSLHGHRMEDVKAAIGQIQTGE